jgi:hypothetical protein
MVTLPSNDPPHWLDFKGIAASVSMACQRASQSQLTGSQLRQAAFVARSLPRLAGGKHEELRSLLAGVGDDHLHDFGRELQRSTLITAIGILDFCLFEVLIFMVGIRHEVFARLPKDLAGRSSSDTALVSAAKSLRRTSIDRRLSLMGELLGVTVRQDLIADLKPLLEKRHAIIHNSKFYETVPLGEAAVIEAVPFPEVSFDEAMSAMITITEIADSVLVGVATHFFNADLGLLRPLNPAVADFNRSMRERIQANKERGPEVETVANAGWRVHEHKTLVAVIDDTNTVSFSVTGIDSIPVSVFCIKHDVHGEKVYVTIDNGEREEAGFMRPAFLDRLLGGQRVLVEYRSSSTDRSLYLRLPLKGFATKWTEALTAKALLSRTG